MNIYEEYIKAKIILAPVEFTKKKVIMKCPWGLLFLTHKRMEKSIWKKKQNPSQAGLC